MNWEIVELEKCAGNDSKIRERYHIETLHPLYNFHTPGLTDEEAQRKFRHTEKRKEYTRTYQSTEKYKAQKNARRRANKKSKFTPK